MCRMVIFLMLVTLAAAAARTTRYHGLHYLECIDSADCNGYECCVFLGTLFLEQYYINPDLKEIAPCGKGLYSIPRCMNRGGPMARCNSKQSMYGENRNVTYLDGAVVAFSNIFYQSCPCELGLECDRRSNKCTDPLAFEDFNDLQMK